MNSADVVDHRLDGVDEPDLYIALLKRVQTANAQTRVDVEQAQRDAAAQVADLKQQVLSEKQDIEMLRTKFSKQRSTPAIAEQERMVLQARAEAARLLAKAQAEIDQLKEDEAGVMRISWSISIA